MNLYVEELKTEFTTLFATKKNMNVAKWTIATRFSAY